MSQIKIGWGEVSLTPNGRTVNLAGQFYERITDVVETPIATTALAIESGDDAVVFCACDLVSTSRSLLNAVREKLCGKIDLPLDKIIISAIHTHTAPSYAHRSDSVRGNSLDVLTKLMPDIKYEKLVSTNDANLLDGEEAFEFIADRIAEAVKLAWDNRADGIYATSFGRAAVGMCRRVCYDDGSAKMWGDVNMANFTELEAGNDSGVELLFTYTPDKKLTGVVANVACPAQVLEHRDFISSDYFGKLKGLIRKQYGEDVQLLGLVSPAGDQCPRDMIRWVEPETPINDPNIVRETVIEHTADPSMFDVKGCETVARRLANEVFFALENVDSYIDSAELTHKTILLDMPLRRVTIADRDNALAALEKFKKEHTGTINFRDNARMHIYAGTVARYETQQTVDTVEIEFHVLRLGDIAFATNPYELFLNYGNQIRARSLAKQTFLIQLCCGSYGYLPTEKAENGSHYSAYVSSGTSGHEGGNLLVRKTLTEINAMWKK
ncbi:MAG: hypothetical protein IJX80_02400 [Clostridia bacterium]|nr:hypothetical protein [Clostridia bacterium]